MAKQKRKPSRRKDKLETLRFFTSVASSVMGRPMSPSHQEAIVHYAAKKLPGRALNSLRTKSGGEAALTFIMRTLEQPQISR
jgi:hypothetical protein